MLDRILANLSLRRSVAGVYYELRTLRQMLEVLLTEHYQLPLPRQIREQQSQPLGADEQLLEPPTEEQLAQEAADQITRDRLLGRDPGTTWVEDPNR